MSGETYGEMIARLRNEKGWTQDELAEASGVGKRTVQAIEGGETKTPHRRIKSALAMALGIGGDPGVERKSWPADVQLYLDVAGAVLTSIDEGERHAVLVRLTNDLMSM